MPAVAAQAAAEAEAARHATELLAESEAGGEASPRRKVDDVWERKVWFESHQ